MSKVSLRSAVVASVGSVVTRSGPTPLPEPATSLLHLGLTMEAPAALLWGLSTLGTWHPGGLGVRARGVRRRCLGKGVHRPLRPASSGCQCCSPTEKCRRRQCK